MPVCAPCCGIGVRHIQYIFCAVLMSYEQWSDILLECAFERAGNWWASALISHDATTDAISTAKMISFTVGRICASLLVMRVKNKYLLLFVSIVEMVISSVCYWKAGSITVPVALAVASILGFVRGFPLVLVFNILAKWAPPSEYTAAWAIIHTTQFSFGMLFKAYHSRLHGNTTLINYFVALPAFLLLAFMYGIMMTDGPETSFLLSKVEYDYLALAIGPRKKVKCSVKIPWKSILSTPFLYGWLVADFVRKSTLVTIGDVHEELLPVPDMITLVWCEFSAVVLSILICVGSVYISRLVSQEIVTNGQVSKVFCAVGACGISIIMIVCAYISSDLEQVFPTITVGSRFGDLVTTAIPVALMTITPNYSAVIYGLSSVVKFWLVLAVFWLNKYKGIYPYSVKTFETLCYEMGFLFFLANLVYLLSGPIERKSFDNYETVDWKKQSIVSYP